MIRSQSLKFAAICSILSLTLLQNGCGPATPTNAPEVFDAGNLEDVGGLYRSATNIKKTPPKAIGDLIKKRDVFMAAYNAIDKGDVIVYWGVTMVGGDEGGDSAEVLAYKSNVPEVGGPVLLKNGTVVKMTADQFKAAPKPSGPTSTATPTTTKK